MEPVSELTIDEFRRLADFWSEKGDAISMYFQAPVPAEKAHREEPILAKEKIKQKLKTLQGNGTAHRADIARVLDSVAAMKGNHRMTKVIFACGRQNMWREYDVPGDFGQQLEIGGAFALVPLLADQQMRKSYSIALADRACARLLRLEARQMVELDPALKEEVDLEKIRTTGARKSASLERKKEEQARRHFTHLADLLLQLHEKHDLDALVIGCRSETWPEIEAELHPELKRILVGRFTIDPGLAKHEEIAQKAQALIDVRDRHEEEALMERIVGSAASNRLGALGVAAVIDALEKGEVRTLLFPRTRDGVRHAVALCSDCQHLVQSTEEKCDLCGGLMRQYDCAEEALLRHGIGRSIEIRRLIHTELPEKHVAAAGLRFKADRSTAMALAS